MPLRHRYKPVGVTLGKKLSSRKTGELLCLSGETGFRFYGAAVSLSRRRSLRRGTPGHDGFPRALGIMPLRHRYKPVGVTLGKKLSSRKTGELLCLSGKRIKAKSHMCFEKPQSWWLLETHVASQRYRGSGIGDSEPTVPTPLQKQRSPPQTQRPQPKRSGSATEPAKQTQYPEHDAPYATCRPGSAPQSGQPPAYPGT